MQRGMDGNGVLDSDKTFNNKKVHGIHMIQEKNVERVDVHFGGKKGNLWTKISENLNNVFSRC